MNVFYRSSPDGGQSWNPEQMISSDDGYNSESPKIAVSEDGQSIHVIWVDSRNGAESFPTNTEIYYARSLDGGATWEPEVRLTNAWYSSTSIQIEAEGSDVHILWSDARFGVSSWDLFYKVSHDGGASWSADSMIASTPSTEGPCTIAASGSAVHAAWVDYSNPIYYLCYRNSTDNGDSWNPPVLLTGPSQMIVKPDISAEGGNVRVVWDDSRDGDIFKPEIYFKNSTDGGISWSPDLRLTHNLSGASQWPRIASTNNMNHVVWFDDRDGNSEIYYKRYPDFPTADIEPPEIRHDADGPTNIGQPINITANLTDDTGVDSVYLNYTAVNGTHHNVSMIKSGDNYSYNIPGQNNTGIVEYFIWANDTSGNANHTGIYTIWVAGPAQANITLHPGWNLISFPVLWPKINDTEIKCAHDLAAATGAEMVSKWDAAVQHYVNYIPGFNNPADPENFDIGEDDGVFLWMNISGELVLLIEGYEPGPRDVLLLPGWNIVAYKRLTAGDAEAGWAWQVECATPWGVYDDICYYNGTTFIHYIFPGTPMELAPGRGYFVWSDEEIRLGY